MAIRKPFIVTKKQADANKKFVAHNFMLNHDEWEYAVFQNAVMFSVVAFRDNGRYRGDFDNLPEAIAAAAPHDRILVYAITKDGRSVLLQRDSWDAYLKEWKEKHEQTGPTNNT